MSLLFLINFGMIVPKAKEHEIVAHGHMSVEKGRLNMSFTDGTTTYKVLPYSINGTKGVMFHVYVSKEPDERLRMRLKRTIKALKDAEPSMVLDWSRGIYRGVNKNTKMVGIRLFGKLIILPLHRYKMVMNETLAYEVGIIDDMLLKFKTKFQQFI